MAEAAENISSLGDLPLSKPDLLVDWLEFHAFLSGHSVRIGGIIGSFEMQAEDENEDSADKDAKIEQLKEKIEAEINLRKNGLAHAYPFSLSNSGEQFCYNADVDEAGNKFYIFCLIVSHMEGSSVLTRPLDHERITTARNRLFQIVATLAVSGHIEGPAVSLGSPRGTKETILEVIRRALVGAQTGSARDISGEFASRAAKDGGIDVLGWTPFPDRPPPSRFVFGQAATGKNWFEKPVKEDAKEFIENYVQDRPRCNYYYITICPHRVSDHKLKSYSLRHGTILDRTRTPYYAVEGLRAAVDGREVDEVENIGQVTQWVMDYRDSIRDA